VLLLRREAIEDVGTFDERFFLYAEETDWQRRARDRGWTSAVCESAVAEHAGAGTSTDRVRREKLFHAAQETYIRKWHGGGGWLLYRVAACLGGGIRTLALTRARRRQAALRTILYLRGPRRCATKELK
jgi:GT2 family glycosyltransferase